MKTADEWLAGTNSGIAIEIFGTEGHMGKSSLRGSYERDDTDTTRLWAYIGEPYKIRLYHDGSGTGSGWAVSWVLYTDFFFCSTKR